MFIKWFINKFNPINYKIINGVKVHFTGPMSVDRTDAIRANINNIKKIYIKLDKSK